MDYRKSKAWADYDGKRKKQVCPGYRKITQKQE